MTALFTCPGRRLAGLLLLTLCVWSGLPAEAAASFRPEKLAEMEATIRTAIADQRCPGGVVWLERAGQSYRKALGRRAVVPKAEPMTEDTIFDAASLTKVIATTPSIMLLVQRGQIRLEAPVRTYLPTFDGEGRDAILVRHLLTHTSGLRPGIPGRPEWTGYDRGIELATAEVPTAPPDTAFRYSDVNFILLGDIVRRVGGRPLNEFAAREVFGPLRMRDTTFLPAAALRSRIAPTEQETNGVVYRGVVHDPTARRMGGVAGHAGLFTTAADLARFARLMLHDGELGGTRLFRPETVRLMTQVQTPPAVADRRGLGWDLDSPYAGPRGEFFPLGSYGHTGWTGTSLWIDPFSDTFLIFLSNRNHPTEDGGVVTLRRALGTLAAQAIPDFNFAYVPGALPPRPALDTADRAGRTSASIEVLNGIDALAKQGFAPLKGLRIGLITNHTGHDRHRRSTIDLLHQAEGVKLVALFSPEHGIRGLQDETISDVKDEPTGLPVYSLYGERRQPSPEQLRDLDALVFDIQDIGCRFYTYISTMGLGLEAAATAKIKFIVLDRVNPIGGTVIEGAVHRGERTFVAHHPLPLRHGMTVGELARLFVQDNQIAVDLTVVPVEGWTRGAWWDETGLPWTNPSPNMRNLTEATVYPGVGLLESAVSVGRGTDTPFEVVGAPYVDDVRLAEALNRSGLAGVRFVPIRFTPRASVFKDQPCGGVYLVVTDRNALRPVDLGLTLALTLRRMYPAQFALDKLQPLLQHRPTLEGIRAGKSLADLKKPWASDLAEFRRRRDQVLLYR